MNGKLVSDVAHTEPLSIYGAEADPPLGGVAPGQLGDVVSRLAGPVGLTPLVHLPAIIDGAQF